MAPRHLASQVMNGLAVLVVAIALLVALANMGFIARPSSEAVSFGV